MCGLVSPFLRLPFPHSFSPHAHLPRASRDLRHLRPPAPARTLTLRRPPSPRGARSRPRRRGPCRPWACTPARCRCRRPTTAMSSFSSVPPRQSPPPPRPRCPPSRVDHASSARPGAAGGGRPEGSGRPEGLPEGCQACHRRQCLRPSLGAAAWAQRFRWRASRGASSHP